MGRTAPRRLRTACILIPPTTSSAPLRRLRGQTPSTARAPSRPTRGLGTTCRSQFLLSPRHTSVQAVKSSQWEQCHPGLLRTTRSRIAALGAMQHQLHRPHYSLPRSRDKPTWAALSPRQLMLPTESACCNLSQAMPPRKLPATLCGLPNRLEDGQNSLPRTRLPHPPWRATFRTRAAYTRARPPTGTSGTSSRARRPTGQAALRAGLVARRVNRLRASTKVAAARLGGSERPGQRRNRAH